MGMGDRIKERRKKMGYTQTELGEKLGLQASAIAKYENGRVENIKRSVIANMAKVLECSPSYLIGLETEKQIQEIRAKKRLDSIFSLLSGVYDDVVEHPYKWDESAEPNYELIKDGKSFFVQEHILFHVLELFANMLQPTIHALANIEDQNMVNEFKAESISRGYTFDEASEIADEYKNILKNSRLSKSACENFEKDAEILWNQVNLQSHLEANTAHARTDIEPTDEDQAHDDAIMNDDSEWE